MSIFPPFYVPFNGRNGICPIEGIDTDSFFSPFAVKVLSRNGICPIEGIDTAAAIAIA